MTIHRYAQVKPILAVTEKGEYVLIEVRAEIQEKECESDPGTIFTRVISHDYQLEDGSPVIAKGLDEDRFQIYRGLDTEFARRVSDEDLQQGWRSWIDALGEPSGYAERSFPITSGERPEEIRFEATAKIGRDPYEGMIVIDPRATQEEQARRMTDVRYRAFRFYARFRLAPTGLTQQMKSELEDRYAERQLLARTQ